MPFSNGGTRGLPQGLVDRFRGRLRVACSRADLPAAGSIDSQSVQAAGTAGAASRGFDGAKKVNGRKRHIAIDTLGLVLAVIVTTASVQDRKGVCRLLALLRERFSTIALVCADGGYSGRLVRWARGTDLRPADALSPSSPRLRTTPQTLRSDGVGDPRCYHDPATGPHNGRRTASSPMGQTPRPSTSTRRTRSARSVTTYQQALHRRITVSKRAGGADTSWRAPLPQQKGGMVDHGLCTVQI